MKYCPWPLCSKFAVLHATGSFYSNSNVIVQLVRLLGLIDKYIVVFEHKCLRFSFRVVSFFLHDSFHFDQIPDSRWSEASPSIILPPPWFTVGTVFFESYSSPFFLQTSLRSKRSSFLSSEQMTGFHYASFSKLSLAYFNLAWRYLFCKSWGGFFGFFWSATSQSIPAGFWW